MQKIKSLIEDGKANLTSIVTVKYDQVPYIVGEWLLDHHVGDTDYEKASHSLEYGNDKEMIALVESWTISGLPIFVLKGDK